MAIQPPSDIILDVARNADSTREAAAVRRLEALAAGETSGGNFASTLDKLSAPQKPSGPTANAALTFRAHGAMASAKSGDRSAQVAQDFEASLLGSLVNEMMPNEAPSLYGQGVGGDVWKSMFAEQIAHQLAKSGTLGLARRLFATHPIESLRGHPLTQTSVADAAQRAVQASSLPLSIPFSAGGDNLKDPRRS